MLPTTAATTLKSKKCAAGVRDVGAANRRAGETFVVFRSPSDLRTVNATIVLALTNPTRCAAAPMGHGTSNAAVISPAFIASPPISAVGITVLHVSGSPRMRGRLRGRADRSCARRDEGAVRLQPV